MIALYMLFLITIAGAHKAVESTEDIDPPDTNVTILYPVNGNITKYKNKNEVHDKIKNVEKEIVEHTDKNIDCIEAFKKFINKSKNESYINANNTTVTTHESVKSKLVDKTTWKIEANFANPNHSTEEKDDKLESKEESKEFRPSQLLGYIVEEVTPKNVAEVTPANIYDDFRPSITNPSSELYNFQNEEYDPNTNKRPPETFQDYAQFPYSLESYTKPVGSWSIDTLDPRPTEEAPVSLPAGGLYQLPDTFKDHSGLSGDRENYELALHGVEKEHYIKKRVNPWKDLLRFVTAIIPASLLISALAPNVITVSPGPDNYYPSKIIKRSDGTDLSAISEQCRRRLLCELRSDANYSNSPMSGSRRQKQCYKIICEDKESLTRMLRWLLSYHRKHTDGRSRDLT